MAKSIMKLTNQVLELLQRFRRVLLYGLIGLSALGLELVIFYIVSQQLGASILLGNGLGMLVGLVFAFALNSQYNFQVRDRKTERFLRYALVAFGGYLMTSAIIFGVTQYAGLTLFIAKLISLPPYFVFQYNAHRLFTFHEAETVPVTDTE